MPTINSRRLLIVARRSAVDSAAERRGTLAPDPVDQVKALWTKKTSPQGGLDGKRICALWMSEGLMVLQLDPLDHPFDPEDQAPTLWISAN